MNVAKRMKKFLSNKGEIDKILLNSRNMDEVFRRFGYVLSFYIATRSLKSPTIDGFTPEELNGEYAFKKLTPKQRKTNIIKNGFVSHSFNGYIFEKVKKFGLGTSKIYDESLKNDFDFICSYLGEGEYTLNQGGGQNEIYYATPGAKTFHYACGYSPERLWLGPLRQDRKNSVPIKVGESKLEYASRVLESKVEVLDDSISFETKKEILEKGKNVINKMCSKKPVVALIPVNSKKFQLTAYHASTRRAYKQVPLFSELIAQGTGSFSVDLPETFFTEDTYLIENNNLGNLVHVGKISASQLEFFEVEDTFSLMQRKAILKGLQEGDEIDYFSGEKIKPREEESKVEQTDTKTKPRGTVLKRRNTKERNASIEISPLET